MGQWKEQSLRKQLYKWHRSSKLLTLKEWIIWKLILRDFIFPETKEEGEWYNLNYATKHELLVNRNNITIITDWMLQIVLAHDKTKKAHSTTHFKSKESYKFKQELNLKPEWKKSQLQSKQEILRKQPMQRDIIKSNKTGKTNFCMESTHCEVKTLM